MSDCGRAPPSACARFLGWDDTGTQVARRRHRGCRLVLVRRARRAHGCKERGRSRFVRCQRWAGLTAAPRGSAQS
eukprot:scaffold132205_cov33-Tisochrysis_lutea.AAC.5